MEHTELDGMEYRKIKMKLEPEIERLMVKITELAKGNTNETEIIDFGFYFLRNMDKLLPVRIWTEKVYPWFDLP